MWLWEGASHGHHPQRGVRASGTCVVAGFAPLLLRDSSLCLLHPAGGACLTRGHRDFRTSVEMRRRGRCVQSSCFPSSPPLTGSAPQKRGAEYSKFYLLYFVVVFELVSCSTGWLRTLYVSKKDLKRWLSLPSPPKCWGSGRVQLCSVC